MKSIALGSRLGLAIGLLVVTTGCAGLVTEKVETAAIEVESQQPNTEMRPGAGITRYPVKLRQLRSMAAAPTVAHQ